MGKENNKEKKNETKTEGEDVLNKYSWDLTDIYENEELIYDDIEKIDKIYPKFLEFKGKLNDKEKIKEYLKLADESGKLEDKVSTYTFLKGSVNQNDLKAKEIEAKLSSILRKYSDDLTFISPELAKNSDEFLLSIPKEKGFEDYNMYFEDIVEDKKHTLSEEMEELVTHVSKGKIATSRIYNYLSESELVFEDAKDSKGNIYPMSNATYLRYISNKDETLRKTTYFSMMNAYKRHNKSFSEAYMALLRSKEGFIRYRNYPTYIESRLEGQESNLKVYNTLIESVNNNLDYLQRFRKINKNILKKSGMIKGKMKPWDGNLNPFETTDDYINFEDAKKMVLESLSILGKEYVSVLNKAFDEKWIDAFSKENKESGGYNLGIYGLHPYILLNYQGKIDDVSTLAHELGHSSHSYFTNENNSDNHSTFGIIVAEVASTVNEILLSEYLIEKETDLKKKAQLVYEQISTINASFYTQARFSEFEQRAFEIAEKKEPVYSEVLNNLSKEIDEKYLPSEEQEEKIDKETEKTEEELEIEEAKDLKKYNWTRIPHFYRPFYVYQYATGIASAIYIATNIQKRGKEYLEKYLKMLKSGGSDRNLEILKISEVDLEDKKVYEGLYEFLNKKLDLLEELSKEVFTDK